MSTHVDFYAEGFIDNEWQLICLYGRDYNALPSLIPIPLYSGGSVVYTAVHWQGCMSGISSTEISHDLRKIFRSPDSMSYYEIPGAWFLDKNYEVPEYCGYFPRQDIVSLQADPDMELNVDDMLSADEFRTLNQDEQQAYQYYEYTAPYGQHDVMRNLRRQLDRHIAIHNSCLRVFDPVSRRRKPNELNLETVRIIAVIT